jgi:hypothetical protein
MYSRIKFFVHKKLYPRILFSSDLDLVWDKMVEYYQLRFLLSFNFRDAKQFWGLEDFMNIKQTQVEGKNFFLKKFFRNLKIKPKFLF